VTFGFRIVVVLAVVGCRDRHAEPSLRRSPLETAIEHELSARFGQPATVSCNTILRIKPSCDARLGDGATVPIVVDPDRDGGWQWRVNGFIVDQSALTEYIAGALAELHVDQKIDCTPSVHVVESGERTTCRLSGGGLAFVQIAADGNARLELELTAAGAAARGEPVSLEREHELLKTSKSLEGRAGVNDGEEDEATGDGGVEETGDDGGVVSSPP
jgi:hypothetical protein